MELVRGATYRVMEKKFPTYLSLFFFACNFSPDPLVSKQSVIFIMEHEEP